MGFSPSKKDIVAVEVYASWHEKGKKAVPPHGGARSTWYENQSRGYEILRRIEAVGGASNSTELRRKELEKSPEYIAEQKRIADEKIRLEEQRLLNIKLNEEKIVRLEQELADKEEQERLEKERLEKERLEQEELIWKQLEFLENQSNEIDSFYDFDKTVKEIDNDIQTIDSNEGIEGMNGIDSMSNQIPLEKITPVMLLLGAGIVFYLFSLGKFDKK
jgi:hypothetical protein